MPRQDINGLNLHYELVASTEMESAATVVFLHGLGSSSKDWSDQVPVLLPKFSVLLVDLRGHGLSDKPAGPYSIKGMAADVASLLAYLNLTAVHAVGLSMGAQIAMQLALDSPNAVTSVTAVNSPADMVPRRITDKLQVLQRKLLVKLLGMRRVGTVIAKKLFPDDKFAERRVLFEQRWAGNDTASYYASLNAILRWDITPELSHIKQPILVIAAREDYTPLAWKERIVELAPDAKLVVVENSRHATPVERPNTFNRILLDFLAEQSAV